MADIAPADVLGQNSDVSENPKEPSMRLMIAALAVAFSAPVHAQPSSEISEWTSEVMSEISSNLNVRSQTPDGDQIWGMKEAVISVAIAADGEVSEAEIVQGTGYEYLDQAAIRAILRSSPLPAFPSEASEEGKSIMVPVRMIFPDKPVS